MTRLLEQAIEQIRTLPESDQDLAAELLFALAAKRTEADDLDEETIAAINEGLAQADRGRFVDDETMVEFFRQRGA